MNEELRQLLQSWEVDDDYLANFERLRIKKVSTLKLLIPSTIEKLFPEDGPRLEFLSHWNAFVKQTDHNGNVAVSFHSCNASEATLVSTEELPQVLLEGDESITLEVSQPEVPPIHLVPPTIPVQQSGNRITQTPCPKQPPRTCKDPDDLAYDLEALLKSCLNGKLILSHYQTHKELSEGMRCKLADFMISDFLQYDSARKLPFEIEKAMAAHIVKLFPTEKMELWVSSKAHNRDTAIGRGKIIIRYYHIRRTLLKNCLIKRPVQVGRGTSRLERLGELSHNYNALTQEEREELEEANLWLKNSKQPWSTVVEFWRKTSKWRLHNLTQGTTEIHDYMKDYPALADPSGYLLLEADFECLYPNSSMKLYVEWPKLSAFILNNVTPKVKETIESSFTPNGRKIRTLRALSYQFPVQTAIKKGKKQWRLSRLECQDALIMLVSAEGDIQTDIARRRAKYEEYGLQLGPIAVMVGQDEDNISSCYVCINNIMYSMENPVKALDLCLKVFHALDAEYNREVLRECIFLQNAVYDIPAKQGEKPPDAKTSSLIDAYKSFKTAAA